jgi:hypothetical protein
MSDLISLLAGGDPLAVLFTVTAVAPWAFILTGLLVPRSILRRADRDRDRALAAVDKLVNASTVTNDRLADIERSLRVVEQFVTALPNPRGRGGRAA